MLWECLQQSRLLTHRELATVRGSSRETDDPSAVLRRLVDDELITPWQAEELAAGRHRFFLGQYKLLDRLAAGGRGIIYKASQSSIGRVVALKVLAREFHSHADSVARFKQEVRAVARLDHPNIVRAYDACTEGRVLYLVLEYVPGEDLSHWLYRHKPLPVEWTCHVVREVAKALAHAHENGLIHRDVKPGNVMVMAENTQSVPQVKLLDLGFARLIDEAKPKTRITQTGQIFGTPDYMSPEQTASTGDVDRRSDLYSLGCTLFKALTNRSPFTGGSSMERIMARTDQPPPRLRQFRPDAPVELEAVLCRMMATRPENRYARAEDVIEALSRFCIQGEDHIFGDPRIESGAPSASPNDTQVVELAGTDTLVAVPHPKLQQTQAARSSSVSLPQATNMPSPSSTVGGEIRKASSRIDPLAETSSMSISRSQSRSSSGRFMSPLPTKRFPNSKRICVTAVLGATLGGLAGAGLAIGAAVVGQAAGLTLPVWVLSDVAVVTACLGAIFLTHHVEPE
jgi:serine/threonine-protein kinase